MTTGPMLPNQIKTLREAIAHFREKAEAGKVRHRITGRCRRLSKIEQDVVISHATTAMKAACGQADPLDEPLAPYLEVLVSFAELDAEAHGRSSSREASSVRLFLGVVEGKELTTRRRVVREAILPAWLPLYDALANLRDANQNRRNPRSARYPGYLYALQTFLQIDRITSPYDLPGYDELRASVERRGVRRKELDNWLTAYRTARAQVDSSLPDLAPTPVERHRGLRGLPDLDRLITQAADRDPRVLNMIGAKTANDVSDQLDLITALSPRIGEAVRLYLVGTSKSADWRASVVTATSCMLAELVRMGRADTLGDLDHLSLFTDTVELQVGHRRAGTVGLLERHISGFDQTARVSLLRAYIDRAARRSFDKSPIELADTEIPEDEVPWYTEAVFNELSAIWAVTDFVYGNGAGAPEGGLAAFDAERWQQIQTGYELLRRHMKAVNGRRQSTGHKDKTRLDFTWATLVCVGLSDLWAEAHALRTDYHAICGRYEVGSPIREKARRAYHRCLQDYVLAAILLDDGLRIKNYARGRVGTNFMADVVRGEDDSWDRIVAVTTRFRGYDADASLKMQRHAGGRERFRTRSLLPGIVDMTLVTDYWLDARPYAMTACGLLSSPSAFDPDADRFALFISPISKNRSGAYSPPQLSKRFGRFLHTFMREGLGRDIPSWSEVRGSQADPSIKQEWRGLLGAHPVRLLIGSYVGGVRKDWERASFLTDDAIATLQTYYTTLEPIFREAKRKRGIENPHHFDRVIDYLWDGNVVDWASFDREDPDRCLPPRP